MTAAMRGIKMSMPIVTPSRSTHRSCAARDRDELGRTQRHVGALEQDGHVLPVGRAAERALTAQHQEVAQGQAALLALKVTGPRSPVV